MSEILTFPEITKNGFKESELNEFDELLETLTRCRIYPGPRDILLFDSLLFYYAFVALIS